VANGRSRRRSYKRTEDVARRRYITQPLESKGSSLWLIEFTSRSVRARAKEREECFLNYNGAIRIAGVTIDALVKNYAAGPAGAPAALINSNGQVEIFVKEGSAADLLTCSHGERIELS